MESTTLIVKNELEKLPKTAGVYLFYEKTEPIYIGKAINIKDRVKNHFFQPTYKDNLYIQKVQKIGFIQTLSEIEALVLEASLIKKYQPKFNSVWRDDKNYFYVAITKDKKPIVYITHQKKDLKTNYIGPFVEGNSLKKTLKFLRKVFPFYTTAKHPEKPCTWCHLGLCPGPLLIGGQANPNLVEYKKNIKKLTLILEGKRKTVLYSLKKEMADLSNEHKFEEALKIRDKISALEQVMAHTHVIEGQKVKNQNIANEAWPKTEKILQEILNTSKVDNSPLIPLGELSTFEKGTKTSISKIECYDISNIQGTQAVGSMVVFVNGKPDKSQYKKFRIRMENKPNDIAMLTEVLQRRLAHPEWGYPEVILIDGGIAQLNVGIKAKQTLPAASGIKIISIAKGKFELLIEGKTEKIPMKALPQEIYNLIVHLDDEAHRFAISYHRLLRSKGSMA